MVSEITKMVDNFMLMTEEQRLYVYQNSVGKVLGIEIAYHIAQELVDLKEKLGSQHLE